MAQARIDISDVLDSQKIGAFHIKLLVFSFLVVMCDGYDIGAAAFAGPALIKEWGLKGPELGVLFSATLVAGLIGSPLLGYLSDHFGRKRVVVGAALFFGVMTWASVLANSLTTMTILRFIAGIGIAGLLPIIVSLNNEFAPRRFRATLVVIMFTGVTFGGGLPGVIAANFMASHGWRLLFEIGGLAPIVVAIALIFVLPESIKFLALHPRRRGELVALLHRLRPSLAIGPQTEFVIRGEDNRPKFSLKALFDGRLAALTPLFWITNAINLMVFYFVNQWMPTILSTSGVSVAHAAIATTLFQFGGTVGGLLIMRPLDKYGFIPVPILFACAIPIIACIGLTGLPESAVMTLVALAGFCLLGLQFGNIAMESNIYPTYIRSWGVGSCFAAGRVGSAVGPLFGGYLIAMQLPLQTLFFIAAIPLAIGLVAALIITPLYRKQFHGVADDGATAAAVAGH
jgi:AAHS family 4-hydroxybenzoate transporter-like MFS transporter